MQVHACRGIVCFDCLIIDFWCLLAVWLFYLVSACLLDCLMFVGYLVVLATLGALWGIKC